jgi:hypothetical protein
MKKQIVEIFWQVYNQWAYEKVTDKQVFAPYADEVMELLDWHKVEDGLPGKYKKVLIYIEEIGFLGDLRRHDYFTASLQDDGKWLASGLPLTFNVTHWLGIAPPKEK